MIFVPGDCVSSSDEIIPESTTTPEEDSSEELPVTPTEVGERHVHKTVSPEDDELHDDEIIEAVRNSLRLWQQGKRNKTHYSRSRLVIS
jgi:hypothetical protein